MYVAEAMGLTEGLGLSTELDAQKELNRGEVVQILKNMLYASMADGTSYAQKNFGLEEKIYVVVATEYQYMVGTKRVNRVDYDNLDESVKYVALAALNADGTYNLEDVIHLTEDELGLEYYGSEYMIGYSYTIASYDEFATVYSCEANATETFKNYGDDGKQITAGNKYNNVGLSNIVKIGDTTYSMVDEYTVLNNKASQKGKTPEIIVHSMFKGASDITTQYYVYDANFNILDPDDTSKIALMYNHWNNTYYAVLANGGYRVATDEDFAKYAVSITGGSADQFGVTTTAKDLTTISFSQITMIDDNGDGVWDRAIYVPYSVGEYITRKEKKAWVLENSKDSGDSEKTVVKINGAWLGAWATNESGSFGSSPRAKIQESNIVFANGQPAKNDFVVYYYNPYSRIFTVVENLGPAKKGTVLGLTQGTYTYDENGYNDGAASYYWKDATVTIDEETYKIGYRGYETQSQYRGNDTSKERDLVKIDSEIARYGYSDQLYASLQGNAYKKMSYVVLAGRIIKAGDVDNECTWMAFDYGYYDKTPATDAYGYTTYSYEGDIIGVDADGNILVKAYTESGKGVQEHIKIASINGYNYGLLVEDYAALQYQFSGVGIVNTPSSYDIMKKAVICDFFKTLSADLNLNQTINAASNRQRVFIVSGVDAEGAYHIYTDLELYWGKENVVSYRQPAYDVQEDKASTETIFEDIVTLHYGISERKLPVYDDYVVLNKDSVVVVAGSNGLKVMTGIPENGTVIDFNDGAVAAYALSNGFMMLAARDLTCEKIVYLHGSNESVFDADKAENTYNFYMVVGDADNKNFVKNTIATSTFDGTNWVYTYKNLYCLNTGAYVEKTVVNGLQNYKSTDIVALNASKPLGAIYAEKNGTYTLLTTDIVSSPKTSYWGGAYKYAADSADFAEDLLFGGYSKYAAVYETSAKIADQATNEYTLMLDGQIIRENFKLTFDAINYEYNVEGSIDSVTIADNVKSTAGDLGFSKKKDDDGNVVLDKNGDPVLVPNKYNGITIYVDYEEDEYFKATLITENLNDDEDEGDVIVTPLAAAKAAAIKKLAISEDEAKDLGASEKALYDTYKAEINACTTVTAVEKWLEKNLTAANKALAEAAKADDKAAGEAADHKAAFEKALSALYTTFGVTVDKDGKITEAGYSDDARKIPVAGKELQASVEFPSALAWLNNGKYDADWSEGKIKRIADLCSTKKGSEGAYTLLVAELAKLDEAAEHIVTVDAAKGTIKVGNTESVFTCVIYKDNGTLEPETVFQVDYSDGQYLVGEKTQDTFATYTIDRTTSEGDFILVFTRTVAGEKVPFNFFPAEDEASTYFVGVTVDKTADATIYYSTPVVVPAK